MLDLDTLTRGELRKIEELAQHPAMQVVMAIIRSQATEADIYALAFVAKQREKPDVTVDEVDALPLGEALTLVSIRQSEPNPTEPAS